MALGCALGLLAEDSAWAQQRFSTALDVQQFKPRPGAWDVLGVESPTTGRPLRLHMGLLTNYADDMLIVSEPGTTRAYALVRRRTTMDILVSLPLMERLEVGIGLPVVLHQETGGGAAPTGLPTELVRSGVGDMYIQVKGSFAHLFEERLRLGFSLPLMLPTGGSSDFLGAPEFGVAPRFSAEAWLMPKDFRVLANFGVSWRGSTTTANLDVATELLYALAAEWRFVAGHPMALQLTAQGAAPAGSADEEVLPFELIGAWKWTPVPGLHVTLGGGVGITRGFGTPDYRVLGGIGYTVVAPEQPAPEPPPEPEPKPEPEPEPEPAPPPPPEKTCPHGPEDLDGFQDEDGCAEPDNDQDGILDGPDLCPNERETANGFEDADGCPDTAPPPVVDASAAAALEAMALKDSDNDGLNDAADDCPESPEDPDGFEDMDGCPDRDNDRDGQPDKDDRCPLSAEVINGVEDGDGCPDKGETKIKVKVGRIEIRERVYFATGRASIKKRSHSLLDQLAAVLKANPQVTKVRVEGHTDDRGRAEANQRLSQRRADEVREYLIGRGIAETRLEAVGYGETKPIADNRTRAGRETNRRVEVTILEIDGEPVDKAREDQP